MSVLKLLEKQKLADEDLISSDEEPSVQPDEEDKSGDEEVKEESAFAESGEKQWKNRSRILITSGRGTAPGFKLMIKDIVALLPHAKKEVR